MKKLLGCFVILALVITAGGLMTACDGKLSIYNITMNNSEDYLFETDKELAQEGDFVKVTIDLLNPNILLDAVFANDIQCQRIERGVYQFIMPNTDVVVTAQTKNLTEKLENETIYYDPANPSMIAKALQAHQSYAKDMMKIRYKQNLINPELSIISTNKTVLPDDAIGKVYNHASSMSNLYDYSYFNIDLSKVNYGKTFLIIKVKTADIEEIIIKQIEVVEFGKVEIDRWTETINLDLSNLELSNYNNLTVQISDSQAQYSCDYLKSFAVTTSKQTIKIEYTPYHAYFISVYYNNGNGIEFLKIVNTTEDATDEEFSNKYQNNQLTFGCDDSVINLKVV